MIIEVMYLDRKSHRRDVPFSVYDVRMYRVLSLVSSEDLLLWSLVSHSVCQVSPLVSYYFSL